jgi:hypothetical protein
MLEAPRKKEGALLCFVICIGAGILFIAVAFSRHVGAGNTEGECLITNSTIQQQSVEGGSERKDQYRPLFEVTFMHDEETKFTQKAAVAKDGNWFSSEAIAVGLQSDYSIGKNVFCTYKEEPGNYYDNLLNPHISNVITLEDEPGKVPARAGLLITGATLLVFGSIFFLILLCKKSPQYGSLV